MRKDGEAMRLPLKMLVWLYTQQAGVCFAQVDAFIQEL
jgi:hypothetical protein